MDLIAHTVNTAATTWTATAENRFTNATRAELERLMGVSAMAGDEGFDALDELVTLEVADDIPTDFDARTQWPDCKSIAHIRDQSDCGSCWAFGSTEALNDRMCIAGKIDGDVLLSPTDTLACCSGLRCGFSMGCNGGQPTSAWKWFTSTGAVTGADFPNIDDGSTCLPYPFEGCNHHVSGSGKYPDCPSDEYDTPKCVDTCSDSNYGTSYSDDKKMASQSYSLSSVEKIQTDMLAYGPVTAAFTVYEDFPTYTSGVYQHTTGSQLGGHAIEIIGWGVEDGTDYWLVKNSWNEEWGNGGTFKILRGSNECGIEATVSAGQI